MNTVADQFAETLAIAGVKRIYGIVGDSLNGLTDAIRRQGKIEWLHVKHEAVAAFAAGAEAHLTGELAVCAGSCGPGFAPHQQLVRLSPLASPITKAFTLYMVKAITSGRGTRSLTSRRPICGADAQFQMR